MFPGMEVIHTQRSFELTDVKSSGYGGGHFGELQLAGPSDPHRALGTRLKEFKGEEGKGQMGELGNLGGLNVRKEKGLSFHKNASKDPYKSVKKERGLKDGT